VTPWAWPTEVAPPAKTWFAAGWWPGLSARPGVSVRSGPAVRPGPTAWPSRWCWPGETPPARRPWPVATARLRPAAQDGPVRSGRARTPLPRWGPVRQGHPERANSGSWAREAV